MLLDPPIERRGYRLTEVLRRAAAVTTYGGVRIDDGTPVVLKELRFGATAEWKEHDLFAREVEVLAAVRHPSVPRVLERFEADDGGVCLVMERVPGESLALRLARGAPLEESEVVRVLTGVLGVLDHLHALAPPILHRDIKPANVILSPDRVYLVDFGGVGRYMPWAKGGSTIIGTFGYMAPEQLHGDASPRSDLFSVGATAAALLAGCDAGHLPRKGLRIDIAALPAAREPLRSIITKLVEPEPDARFASAAEVLHALAGLSHPTQARGNERTSDLASAPRALVPTSVDTALVLGPRERLPAHPDAVSHWAFRNRARRGLIGGAIAGGFLALFCLMVRETGGSGAWQRTGQGFAGIALCMGVGSRLIRTRSRLVRKLLELARAKKGRLSVADVSMRLRLPPEVARDLLEHMIEVDMARRDPERESGYLILAS